MHQNVIIKCFHTYIFVLVPLLQRYDESLNSMKQCKRALQAHAIHLSQIIYNGPSCIPVCCLKCRKLELLWSMYLLFNLVYSKWKKRQNCSHSNRRHLLERQEVYILISKQFSMKWNILDVPQLFLYKFNNETKYNIRLAFNFELIRDFDTNCKNIFFILYWTPPRFS